MLEAWQIEKRLNHGTRGYFHQVGYRTFKWFYQRHVQAHLQHELPLLPSYQRFIELMPRVLLPHWPCLLSSGVRTGRYFVIHRFDRTEGV